MLRLNLRTKIMICCIGLVALLDLMVVVFVRGQLLGTLRAEYLTHGRTMAENLATRSEHFVLTEDFVSLLQLVKNLKGSDDDVAYAYVGDRKGRVLAHTFAGGFPKDLVGVNSLEPGDRWKRELLDTVEEGLVHDIAVPILQGKVGFAHVGISERGIEQTISHFTLALITIAAFVLIVAVGLAAVVSWAVSLARQAGVPGSSWNHTDVPWCYIYQVCYLYGLSRRRHSRRRRGQRCKFAGTHIVHNACIAALLEI